MLCQCCVSVVFHVLRVSVHSVLVKDVLKLCSTAVEMRGGADAEQQQVILEVPGFDINLYRPSKYPFLTNLERTGS